MPASILGNAKLWSPIILSVGIIACRRFGPQNPQLWVTALQYVASSGAEVPPHHFKEVLDSIEQHRLLSPLLVVSTLSTCPTATLGVVRYLDCYWHLVRGLNGGRVRQAISRGKIFKKQN